MKKLAICTGLLLALLMFFVAPTSVALADPHHVNIYADAACQEGYSFGANYVGGSGWRRVVVDVNADVDGTVEDIDFTWEGVSPGFNLFDRNGLATINVDVTGTVTMYDRTFHSGTSADTDDDTFSNDHDSNSSMNADIDFSDNDNNLFIDADAGYVITYVGIETEDISESGYDLEYAPNTNTFSVNLGSISSEGDEIEYVRVTIFKAGTPSFYTYSVVDLDTFNFHKALDCFEPPDPRSTFEPDCVGVLREDFAWEGGEDGAFVSQGTVYVHYWTLPYEIEEWEQFTEPKECDLPEPSEGFRVFQDCKVFEVYSQYLEDGVLISEELVNDGRWHDPYEAETRTVNVGEGEITFTKDSNCIRCEPKIWLWLLFLEDEAGNVIDTGSLTDKGYDGTYDAPGVERQQACLGWVATRAWGGWVDGCDGWFDSDHRNLDTYYTYQRFDVDTLLDLPCSRCGTEQ